MKRRVLIVDDHAVTRKGYVYLINEAADLDVCGEAKTALEALSQVEDLKPDLVIADVTMDGMSGIELAKHLQGRYPSLPVLIVSMHDEVLYADRALRAGAKGYMMKNEAGPKVVEAARRILSGSMYVSERMQNKIMGRYAGQPDRSSSALDRLSDREMEVFDHLGRGFKTSEIAEAMLITRSTVGSYCERIKEKLSLRDHNELLRFALHHRALHHGRTGGAS